MFWENFKRLCKERGISASNVLKELGISQSMPSAWKHGTSPRADTIERLADYIGVSVADLLNGEKTPSAPSLCAPALTTGELAIIDEYRKNPAFAAVVDAAYAAVKPLKKSADAVS